MTRINCASRLALMGGVSVLSLAAMALPSAVLAQAAPAPQTQEEEDASEVEEVVVTGLRASLASAQAIKQNSDQFVDSITAVDIGRLPDVNVAEALQRVSGIQITRDYGEGSGIAIRGLTNVRSELNGRDIFSANGGRSLSWEEVGSDLLAGVDVYKNPSAEMIEGGLGGTINLRTRMPFDAPGRVVSASASYTHYDLANDNGYGASFLASDRWDTGMGEFGALLNMSYGETAFRQDEAVVEPYLVRTDVPGHLGEEIAVPNGGGFKVGFGERERFSAALALQWRPTDTVELYLQALRTDYTFQDNGLSFFAYGGNGIPLDLAPGATFTVEDGLATSGSFINPGVDAVTFASNRDTYTTDIAVGGKWQVSDNFQLSADLQYIDSSVYQETMNLTASVLTNTSGPIDWGNGGVPMFPGNYQFTFDTTGSVPSFGTDNGYYADLDNYGLTAVLPYRELNDAESWAGRVDLRWDFDEGGVLRDFRAGVRATDRSAINRSTTYGTWTAIGSTCANWSSPAGCHRLSAFPEWAEQFPFRNSFLAGEGQGVFGDVWMFGLRQVGDAQGVFDFLGSPPINQTVDFRSFDDPAAQISNVSETTLTGYGVLRFGSTLFGKEFDGNVGVRVVKTESASDGFQTINYRDPTFTPGVDPVTGLPLTPTSLSIVTPIVGENSYTDVLPSLNLRVHLTPELQLRFAASRNVARPDFSQLNATFNISPNYGADASNITPVGTGTGTATGNPLLDPQRVDAFDAAVEWYFSPVGFVYGTVFRKDIKDLFFNVSGVEHYDLLNPDGSVAFAQVPFNISRLENVDEGTIEGFEVGGQRFFDFLPSPFDGLGIQANYTFIDSNASTIAANSQTGGQEISVPIQGLSENSYNLVLLYEKYGFNARLAYNWRDDYLEGTNNVGTGQLPIFGQAFGVLDGSISYDFNQNVALTFDAQNILNEEFHTYQITRNRYRDYQLDDRRFSVRLRVRY